MSEEIRPEEVKAACHTPPCVLFEDCPDTQAWANRVRQHFASGDHSGELTDQVMFVRMMEAEFQRAMGGKGRWDGITTEDDG